jgi:polysaccharide biosynthesis transport protein
VELHEYLSIARARWRLVIAVALFGGVLAGVLSLLATPTYVAKTRIFFAVAVAGDPRELNRGSSYTRALVSSYAELTSQPVVLDPVIGQLGLDTTPGRLAGDITASSPQGTTIVDISVADSSARRSARIADAVAAQLARVVPALASQNQGSSVPLQVTTVSPASVPTFKSAPRTKVNGGLGLIAGAVIGLGLAVLRHRSDVRISDSEAVRATGAPVLGTLRRPAPATGPLGHRATDQDGDVEQLRTAIQNLRLNGGYRTVMLTSPLDGDLSSATALELGKSLSRAGTRVLVVDADLQQPELTLATDHVEATGLSSVLSEGWPWQLAVFEHGSPPVTVLGAGPAPWNPDLLLESASTESVLRRAARHFDVVLVSAPPVLRVADTLLLSRITDGTVLVADRRRTNRDDLSEGFARLDVVGARVLGVVLRD